MYRCQLRERLTFDVAPNLTGDAPVVAFNEAYESNESLWLSCWGTSETN